MALAPVTRPLKQDATYWPPGAGDGFGGVAYGAAVAIKCRWQDKIELFRNAQGQEVASSAVIYIDREVQPKGIVALGDYTDLDDPLSVYGAREVGFFGASPSVNATKALYKAWCHGFIYGIDNAGLREDGGYAFREDGGYELRE